VAPAVDSATAASDSPASLPPPPAEEQVQEILDAAPVDSGAPLVKHGRQIVRVKRPRIERGDWYIGVGLGVGAAALSPRMGATAVAGLLSLRGGVIVNDIFLAGVGLSSLNQYNGSHELEYVGATMSSVTAEVMVFPVPYLPMSCTAGVGWGSALAIGRLEDDSQGRPYSS
jgi:hypothetical protein